MTKQKIKIAIFAGVIFVTSFVSSQYVSANGSATVSWVAPTTDEGGGALTGLTGYKVYYRATESTWLGMVGSCVLGLGTSVNVSGGNTTSYFFNNNLTPGTTYYFTVAATDGTNISNCGITSGGLTEVSKRVTYSGDLNASQSVDIFDYNILKGVYGTSNIAGDIDRDSVVGIFDYNILKADYGKSFI
jgi:hypothetical protein